MHARPLLILVLLGAAAAGCSADEEGACAPRAAVEGLTDYRQYDVLFVDERGQLTPMTDDRLSFDPSIAPDGSWLALTKARPGSWSDTMGYAETAVQTMAIDGSDVVEIEPEPGTSERAPAVAPDGSQLAFLSQDVGPRTQTRLVVARRDGSQRRTVTDLGPVVTAGTPAWSPDGEQLALTLLPHDRAAQLRVFDVASGTVVHEREIGEFRDLSVWSPQGEQVMMSSSNYETSYSIVVADLHGDHLSEIEQPRRASWTNAAFSNEDDDQLSALLHAQSVEPSPQHLERIDLEGNVGSRLEIEQRPTVEGTGVTLIGGLTRSRCFAFGADEIR